MQTPFAERLARHSIDASRPPAFVLGDDEVSYPELHRRVEHAAAWLRSQGVGANDVVAITVADEIAHLTLSFALLALGVQQVSLPTYEPLRARQELARLLDVTRVVVVDPDDALPGIAASFLAPTDLTAPSRAASVEALVADPEAIALVIASSGTTGRPKLIALGARVVVGRLDDRDHLPRERLLIGTTVEDIFGKAVRLRCAWQGVTSVFRPPGAARSAQGLAAFCASQRVTRLSANVLAATGLVHRDEVAIPGGLDVFVAGSRVPMRLREQFRARPDLRLHVEYGAREVGLCAMTWPLDRDPSVESVGPVARNATIEVVDPEGRPLPPGAAGEIRVRTTTMVHGYYRDPTATARHFRDGWFYCGDIGTFTPSGSLCLLGRADDVMNLNGIKIYPSEIERALESDPSIRAAAAFALRSEVHGEIPVAAVEWQGEGRPDVAALLARARSLLGMRSPRRIVVVDALPRNLAGKIATGELARLVADAS